MATPSVPSKTPSKGARPANSTAAGGKGVRVSPGKGGHKLGTATHCEAKRAASNVREGAY
jgi:hypothetical protein